MSNIATTDIWILDSGLNKITKIVSPAPLDKSGTILRYSKELDDFGQCKFRVNAYDTTLTTYGDIFVPHKNWVQIVRAGFVVWQGAIIENTKRTKEYIEIVAAEPLWYLNKILIQRSSLNPSSNAFQATPISCTVSGTTATLKFQSIPIGAAPAVNGQLDLTNFTPSGLSGIWPITSVSGTTIQVTVPAGLSSATTQGTVIFSDGIYRIFNSGTMAAAVTAIMNETKTTFLADNAGHALSSLTIGTITNPNYPPNITDGNTPPNDLNGPWNFGNGVAAPQLQFDFHTVLYLLKSFGVYAFADFYLDNNLVFNFVPFKGNNLTGKVSFVYSGPTSQASNIIDYNLPRLGQRMVNDLYGIATDINGIVLHYDQTDQASISTYGLIQGVAAYSDVKDQATLNARIQAEVPLVSAPDNAAISIVLNEKGYPLGLYDVGDIVNISVTNRAVSFNDARRVVGISVQLNGTGREFTTVQTNKVLPFQWALAGGGNQTGVTT